jgi:hypothetical protein
MAINTFKLLHFLSNINDLKLEINADKLGLDALYYFFRAQIKFHKLKIE